MAAVKRVFVGGLAASVGENDLRERFGTFGKIEKLSYTPSYDENRPCGYAHFDLEIDQEGWRKLSSAYNGTSWRGSKLKVEEAKPDYLERLAISQNTEKEDIKVRKRPVIRHYKDMTLMTDGKVDERRGWKRGRFGRAVSVMHMIKPGGKMMTYDPDHHKGSIEKLFGTVKPLPISKLTWKIEEPKKDLEVDSDENTESCSSESEYLNEQVVNEENLPFTSAVEAPKSESEIKEEEQEEEKELASASQNEKVNSNAPSSGFSLSKMLGLETIISGSQLEGEISQNKTLNSASSFEKISSNKADLTSINVSSLLFDPIILESTPPEQYAFWRHAGWEEIVSVWKYIRPDIRQSMRTCIKDSKQKLRK